MITNKKHYKEELKNISDSCEKFGGEYKTSDVAYEVARYTSDSGTDEQKRRELIERGYLNGKR